MSMQYSSILGYGLELNSNLFDTNKILTLDIFSDEDRENILEEMEETIKFGNFNIFQAQNNNNLPLSEFIELITELNVLTYVDQAEFGYSEYIIHFAKNPWEMTKEEKELTLEDISKLILDTLKPYLKDNVTVNDILDNIDFIDTVRYS